jgi:nicotinamidase-related amidase
MFATVPFTHSINASISRDLRVCLEARSSLLAKVGVEFDSSSTRSPLIIIDVQQGLFALPMPPWSGGEVVARIAGLLKRARAEGVPVFHVQHDDGPGHMLAKGSPGFLLHPDLAPLAGEPVIEKRESSAFHGTDLDDQLRRAGIHRLVVTGMQSEMCVDSACRAIAHGYRVALVSDGHTTWDTLVLPASKIVAHHNLLLGRICGEPVTSDEVRF